MSDVKASGFDYSSLSSRLSSRLSIPNELSPVFPFTEKELAGSEAYWDYLSNFRVFNGDVRSSTINVLNAFAKGMSTAVPAFERLGIEGSDMSWVDDPNNVLEGMLMMGRGDYKLQYCYNEVMGANIKKDNPRMYQDVYNNLHIDGKSFSYIYGTITKSQREDGNENGWIYSVNAPLGFFYKVSWNFAHPFSASSVNEMSEDDRKNNGMDKDGLIHYRLVFHVNSEFLKYSGFNEFLKGKIRDVEPGKSKFGTVTFYHLALFDHVFIEFVDENGDPTGTKIPSSFECNGGPSLGCFVKTEDQDSFVSGRDYELPTSSSYGLGDEI